MNLSRPKFASFHHSVTLVHGHFVPWSLRFNHFVPPIIISHFVPKKSHFVPKVNYAIRVYLTPKITFVSKLKVCIEPTLKLYEIDLTCATKRLSSVSEKILIFIAFYLI